MPFQSTSLYNPTESERRRNKVAMLQSAWQQGEMKWGDYRRRQIKAFDFSVGNIIPRDVREELQRQRRPIYELQLFKPLLVWMAGKLKRDATKMKAIPIHRGAEDGAYMHTVLVNDWAMEQCSGYKEIAKAAIDSWICGFGAFNNYWSSRSDPEGKHYTRSLDPTAIGFDPDCRDVIGQEDMRYLWYSKMHTMDELISIWQLVLDEEIIKKMRSRAEEIEGMYRDGEGSYTPRSWSDRNQNITISTRNTTFRQQRNGGLISDFADARSGLYRHIEWHDKRYVVRKLVYSPGMNREQWVEIPSDKLNDRDYIDHTMHQTASQDGRQRPMFKHPMVHEMQEEQLWVQVAVPALLTDELMIEQRYSVEGGGFSIKILPCYDWHPDATEVRGEMDSQIPAIESFNQHIMSMHEAVMDMNNPSYDFKKGSIALENLKDWKSKQRGKLREWQGDEKPEPRQIGAEGFRALQAETQMVDTYHERIGGISPAAMGRQQTAKEGIGLASLRAQKTEVMVSHFLDNYQEVMKHAFRYTDRELQEFLTYTREIGILQDTEDPKWITLNEQTLQGIKNNVRSGEYDFKPDLAALGESARKDNFLTLVQIAEMFRQDPTVLYMLMTEVMKNADFPNASKMSKFMEEKAQYMVQKETEARAQQEAMGKLAMIQEAVKTHAGMLPQPVEQAQERVAANA